METRADVGLAASQLANTTLSGTNPFCPDWPT